MSYISRKALALGVIARPDSTPTTSTTEGGGSGTLPTPIRTFIPVRTAIKPISPTLTAPVRLPPPVITTATQFTPSIVKPAPAPVMSISNTLIPPVTPATSSTSAASTSTSSGSGSGGSKFSGGGGGGGWGSATAFTPSRFAQLRVPLPADRKSKLPLFLALGGVAAVGAYFYFKRKKR
jgi:uncharacterized membrane protein YgcG